MYEPLDSTIFETRFVVIEACSVDDKQDCISCRLSKGSLDDSLQYTALSYHWGDAQDTVDINVNGHPILVTRNLESALRELRAVGTGLLWVDAICINQSDDKEKSSQVARMGDIFEKASKVICWLESSTTNSDFGMQRLRDPFQRQAFLSKTRLAHCIENILHRPYWDRIWIVQEIAKARTIELWSGRERLSWDELLSSMAFYDHAVNVSSALRQIKSLQTFRSREFDGNKLPMWQAMLRTFGNWRAMKGTRFTPCCHSSATALTLLGCQTMKSLQRRLSEMQSATLSTIRDRLPPYC